MNWFTLGILLWITLGLDVGFRDTFQLGTLAIAPRCLPLLAVFVALWATPVQAAGVCLLIGLLMDITHTVPTESGRATVVFGAYAIGCLGAASFVLHFRSVLLRRNPVTFVVLCFVCTLLMEIVQLIFLRVRVQYDDLVVLGLGRELGQRLGTAGLTALLAVVAGPFFAIIAPVLGLDLSHGGRRR